MTNLTTTLPASEARSNFYTLLDEVKNFRRFTITRRGRVAAVIISQEEVESWEETLEIMSNPKLMTEIKKAEKQIKNGATIPHKTMMKELGLTEKDLQED